MLFQRLAVFAGGFTLESAEAVGCASERGAAPCTRPPRRSWSRSRSSSSIARAGATGCWKRCASTRRSGSRHRARRTRCAQGTPSIISSSPSGGSRRCSVRDQAKWFARFDLERENLLLVHEWCGTSPDGAVPGLRLVHAIKSYLLTRGMPELALRMTAGGAGATRRASRGTAPAAERSSTPARPAASWAAMTRRDRFSKRASRSRARSATCAVSPTSSNPWASRCWG